MVYFQEFKRYYEKWGILDKDIYNFNEIGCIIRVINRSIVIIPAGAKEAYIDDLENQEVIMSTECISAGNYYVPLMITFKGAYYLYKYF